MPRQRPQSPLFPSPTLFRSGVVRCRRGDLPVRAVEHGLGCRVVVDEELEADPRHEAIEGLGLGLGGDRKSTRLNSSHSQISYAVFCLKKKKITIIVFGSSPI